MKFQSSLDLQRVTMPLDRPLLESSSGDLVLRRNYKSGSTVIEVNHVTDSHLLTQIGCIRKNMLSSCT